MKIGLALSGGGVRGAAHIGAIKALQENGIEIQGVSGTSAGSIVAALYALGYTTDEMINFFRYFAKSVMGISPKFLFNSMREEKSIKLRGLASSLSIEQAVQDAANVKGIKKIKDLKIPIIIPATDLISDKEIVFTNQKLKGDYYIQNIEIGKAVRASSTFPGMYTPFEYKEYQFVDGGIFDNLPVAELKKIDDIDNVLAIKFDLKSPRKQNTMYNITMQSIDLMQENLMQDSIKLADSLLTINLRDVKVFNVDKIDFCYEQGYKQALERIEEIKAQLM